MRKAQYKQKSLVYLLTILFGILSILIFNSCEKNDPAPYQGNECIDKTKINTKVGCFEVYEPVCGCDGITYQNACFAENYGGVKSFTEGACSMASGCIDYEKRAQRPYILCTHEYDPVCGCDGKTYGNACEAGLSGVMKWEEGECSNEIERIQYQTSICANTPTEVDIPQSYLALSDSEIPVHVQWYPQSGIDCANCLKPTLTLSNAMCYEVTVSPFIRCFTPNIEPANLLLESKVIEVCIQVEECTPVKNSNG